MKYLLALLITTFVITQTSAHAIWIETAATGQKGKPQLVKVFFGEYSTGDKVAVKDWFSDIGQLTVWATQPGKKEVQLALVDSAGFYAAIFTPADNGIYNIVLRHPVKELYAGKKLEYNSVATVWVDTKEKANTAAVADVSLLLPDNSFVKGKPVDMIVFFNGKILADQEVEIVSPTGAKTKATTNKGGAASFTPAEGGRYMLEVIHRNSNAGTFNGKEYKGILKIVTESIEVVK